MLHYIGKFLQLLSLMHIKFAKLMNLEMLNFILLCYSKVSYDNSFL